MERNFAYVHLEGCGKPAFYLERMPEAGTVVRSKDAELPDGSKPKAESMMLCGACGEPLRCFMGSPSMTNIVPVA